MEDRRRNLGLELYKWKTLEVCQVVREWIALNADIKRAVKSD